MSSTTLSKGSSCFICAVGVPRESKKHSSLKKSSPTFKLLAKLLKARDENNGDDAATDDEKKGDERTTTGISMLSALSEDHLLLCTTCTVVVQDLNDLQELLENTQKAILKKVTWIRNTFRDARTRGATTCLQVSDNQSGDTSGSGAKGSGDDDDNTDVPLLKVEADDSIHIYDEPFDHAEFEFEDQVTDFGTNFDDARKRIRLSGEEINENDESLEQRLLHLHGLDRQPQPRICLQKLESRNDFSVRSNVKRRSGRKTKIMERDPTQMTDYTMELDIEPKEDCEEKRAVNDDPDLVPSESPTSDTKLKKQRTRKPRRESGKSVDKYVSEVFKFRRKRRTPEEIKQQAHIDYERVECNVCGRPLKISTMKKHQWSHKSEEEKQEWIAAGRPNPVERDHLKNEMARRLLPHQCATCGKRFAALQHVLDHSETHKDKSERQQHVCEECGKIFYTAGGLRLHGRRDHNPDLNMGKWKFCPICPDVKFLIRTHLETHMMRHHGVEKKFICEQCGHRLPCKDALDRHMYVHLDEGVRPFQCEYCPMNYKHPRNLNRHVRSSHPDKYVPRPQVIRPVKLTCKQMYPCDKCEKPFELLSRMKKHLLICKK